LLSCGGLLKTATDIKSLPLKTPLHLD